MDRTAKTRTCLQKQFALYFAASPILRLQNIAMLCGVLRQGGVLSTFFHAL
jgi:hypothetical protein